LAKFQMAPMPSSLISSGQRSRSPGMRASVRLKPHTHTECGLRFPSQYHISYIIPLHYIIHYIHKTTLHNPMMCKSLLKVLCPVNRPITTLDCVHLKDICRAPIAGSGPEINSRACLVYCRGHATMPDAGSSASVSSFFLYSA
jgi:hypothetical protein